MIRNVCVFCGSSLGFDPVYRENAALLADEMVRRDMVLVYGGANVGLMKVLADRLLLAGKEVIGVMPRHLIDKEVAHTGISRMHIVESMSERKNLMVELSDCFITLPGGFGTLDEFAEILTYNQLRLTDKPSAIFNVNGYFDPLLSFFDRAVEDGFLRREHRKNLIVESDAAVLFNKISDYDPVDMEKWIQDIKKESN